MEYAVIVAGITFVLLCVILDKKINTKVESNSKKISELKALNETKKFHQIEKQFDVTKHYDNKGNYNRIEPADIMRAEIKARIDYFSTYAAKVRENREEMLCYQSAVEKILSIDAPANYKELKISEAAYKRRERAIFLKNRLFPVVDCTFNVKMSYSSPKGQVKLSKKESFNFDAMFASLESVSRSRLDKRTYSSLAAVERGEVSDSLRYDIMQRDNFTCVICGASAKQGALLHVDHIVPVSKGGKSVPSNLRTLCERCNIGKSNKIEYASSSEENKTTKEESLLCQKCGAKLVLRKGKYGEFYGCSNYPKCTFTKRV